MGKGKIKVEVHWGLPLVGFKSVKGYKATYTIDGEKYVGYGVTKDEAIRNAKSKAR